MKAGGVTDRQAMQTAVPTTLTFRAPAKLNLSLAILGRRDDGYHEIETLMTAVSLADTLVVRPAALPGVRLRISEGGSGTANAVPADGSNLVVRAITALATAAGVEPALEVDLEKCTPAGAGLGGGSSDAAAAIRATARIWGLDWPTGRLAAVGATIGSDVPWFFPGRPAIASGRGERIEPVPALPALAAVIVWPGVPLSTAAVYRGWGTVGGADVRPGDARRLAQALAADRWQDVWPLVNNDLEPAARQLCPEIDAALEDLARAGAVRPRLTGSGSACFALARTWAEARGIAARLAVQRPADGSARRPLVRAVRFLPDAGG